jgi:hypothetical protein
MSACASSSQDSPFEPLYSMQLFHDACVPRKPVFKVSELNFPCFVKSPLEKKELSVTADIENVVELGKLDPLLCGNSWAYCDFSSFTARKPRNHAWTVVDGTIFYLNPSDRGIQLFDFGFDSQGRKFSGILDLNA